MCVVRCLSAHLRETGRSIVTEDGASDSPGRNALSYIQSLLDLHDQYNMFLEKSFANDKLFKNAIQSVSSMLSFSFIMMEFHQLCQVWHLASIVICYITFVHVQCQ